MEDWNPFLSIIENARIDDHNAEVAAKHVLRYWAEMNAVEKQFARSSPDQLREVVNAKTAVHRKYWAETDDEYWTPCSHSNREEFSLEDVADVVVMTDFRTTFFVRIVFRADTKRMSNTDIGYLLVTESGTEEGPLRIVNEFTPI